MSGAEPLTGPWQIQIETEGKVWCFTYADGEAAKAIVKLFSQAHLAEAICFSDDIGSALVIMAHVKMVRLVNVCASARTSKEAADLHNAIYPPPKNFIEVLNPFSGSGDDDDETPTGMN